MRAVFDKIVRPHVVAVFRAQPDARTVCQPQTAFWLFVRNLQPLTPPDPLDPLVIHEPARILQKRRYLAIAVTAVLASEFDDIGGQTLFVGAPRRRLTLRRTILPERRASTALGDVKLTSNMIDANAAAGGV